jgi:DNA-binding transcriptional MerR regulator
VRISDLSKQTAVPTATIKFYLREHLLPPGTPTARNQADYGAEHLRRLRFIRALTTLGQLDLSTVRELLGAIDDKQLSVAGLYQVVHLALFRGEPVTNDTEGTERARDEVDGFIDGLGWQVDAGAAGRETLARVMTVLRGMGCELDAEFLHPYATAAEHLALRELNMYASEGPALDRGAMVARMVLFEVAFAALRRMAQEHLLVLRLAAEP